MRIFGFIKKGNVLTFLLSLSISILTTLFVSHTLNAKTKVLFSPGGSIKETIINTIISSSDTIDITAFTFTTGDIAEALYQAKERGVEIRIIIDQRQDEKRYQVLEFLKEEGFDLQFLRGNIGGSMNNTFAIFDDKLIVTGSYKWTEYADKFNYENAIFIDESEVIEAYKKEFESLYDKSIVQAVKRLEKSGNYSTGNRSGAVLAGSKEVVLSDSDNVSKHRGRKEKVSIPEDNAVKRISENGMEHSRSSGVDKKANNHEESQKQFVNMSFDEFDEVFGNESKLEKSEKMRLWKDKYEGKYVTWTGKISFRGFAVYDWNKVGISHKGDSIDVNLRFDWTKQKKVMELNVGDVVTYTGKLVSLNSMFSSYRLEDVDVLQIR